MSTTSERIAAAAELTGALDAARPYLGSVPGDVYRRLNEAVHRAEIELDPAHFHYPPTFPECAECLADTHAPHDHPDSMPWREGCPACEEHARLAERAASH